jgi:rhodanese-related sulfurtransferase
MLRVQKLVADAKANIQELSVAQVHDLLANNEDIVLVDTREDHEWETDHLPSAVHCSRGKLEFLIEDAVPDMNSKIILYCRSGARSALAAESLQKMGYTNVYSMNGGYQGWRQSGLEIIS